MPGGVLHTGRIIIATGASPAAPSIPGLDDIPWLASTTAMDLAILPASMIVVGAGYVGCELAHMFAGVGVAVSLV